MLSKKVIRVIQLFFICEILFFEIRPLFGKVYKEVVANSGDSDCLVQSSDSDIFPGYKVKVKEGLTLVGVFLVYLWRDTLSLAKKGTLTPKTEP